MKREIPDFLIEQLYLDELDPRVKEELLQEPGVLERLENLKASNAEILDAYPPEQMAAKIEARMSAVERAETANAGRTELRKSSRPAVLGRTRSFRNTVVAAIQWKGFFPVLAAAAAIALIVGFMPLMSRGGVAPTNASGVHIKGVGPVLHVYRETGAGAELLKNGAGARAHDLLQLSYIAAGAQYGVIFSVDGSGTVTLHFPESSHAAALLQKDGEIALPYSYELDNAPRFESFYLVTSTHDFSIDEILNIAKKAATSGNPSSIAFPAGFEVASLTVNKETNR